MQLFQKAKALDRIKGISSFSMPYSTGRPLGAFSGDCCDRSAAGGLRSETCGDFTSPLCGEIRLAGSPGMGCCEVCRGASTRCRGGCGDAGDGAAACSCRCRGTGRVVDGAASGLRDGRAESSGFTGRPPVLAAAVVAPGDSSAAQPRGCESDELIIRALAEQAA